MDSGIWMRMDATTFGKTPTNLELGVGLSPPVVCQLKTSWLREHPLHSLLAICRDSGRVGIAEEVEREGHILEVKTVEQGHPECTCVEV